MVDFVKYFSDIKYNWRISRLTDLGFVLNLVAGPGTESGYTLIKK